MSESESESESESRQPARPRKPWLQHTQRTYGFTSEHLAEALGLEGGKVIRVQWRDGIWDITTSEKGP
jgi:hypothetical protein